MTVSVALLGDIMFDRRIDRPRLLYHSPSVISCAAAVRPASFVYPNTQASRDWLQGHGVDLSYVGVTSHSTICRPVNDIPPEDELTVPFADLKPVLHDADLVIANLESPLSDRGRPWKLHCCYRAPPAFAGALADANIGLVTLANNHAMDYGEVACDDTLQALRGQGIAMAGAGRTYEEARQAAIVRVGGTRIGVVSYNLTGPDECYATPDVAGVAPLNLLNLEEDASRLRAEVDFLIGAVHWGLENVSVPAPEVVWLAHQMAGFGYNLIVGWHPHVPGPVEFFNDALICYSMGNCVFGHGHSYWGDNMVVVAGIEDGIVQSARLIPIETAGQRVFRPAPAAGQRAEVFVRSMAARSRRTSFRVDGAAAVLTRDRCA